MHCSEHPADLLGRATTIALDGPQSEQVAVGDPESTPDDEEVARVAAMARGHKSTTDEIRSLCADLLVLGRSELRQLLKWRGDVRKKLDAERKAEKADKGEMEGDGKSAGEGERREENEGDGKSAGEGERRGVTTRVTMKAEVQCSYRSRV